MTQEPTPQASGLLPCPFCEGDPISARVDRAGRSVRYRVFCRACLCRTEDEETRAEATAAWNARPASGLEAAPDGEVGRNPDAPSGLYGKVGIAMFKADLAALPVNHKINIVGNAAFEFLSTASSDRLRLIEATPSPEALALPTVSEAGEGWPSDAQFKLGDRVTTPRKPLWEGIVCGWYRNADGRLGFNVEADAIPGAIHNYPQTGLLAASSTQSTKAEDR